MDGCASRLSLLPLEILQLVHLVTRDLSAVEPPCQRIAPNLSGGQPLLRCGIFVCIIGCFGVWPMSAEACDRARDEYRWLAHEV